MQPPGYRRCPLLWSRSQAPALGFLTARRSRQPVEVNSDIHSSLGVLKFKRLGWFWPCSLVSSLEWKKIPKSRVVPQRKVYPGASENSCKMSVPLEPSLGLERSLLKQRKPGLLAEPVAKASLFTFMPRPGLDRRTAR